MDHLLLSFWHLSEVRPLNEPWGYAPFFPVPNSENCFIFADWSISGHEYVVRLTPSEEPSTPVYVVYDGLVPVAPSFQAFLEGYVRGDQEMLFPDPPREAAGNHPDEAV